MSLKKSQPSTKIGESENSRRIRYKRTKRPEDPSKSTSTEDTRIFNTAQQLAKKFDVSYFKNCDGDRIKMFFFSKSVDLSKSPPPPFPSTTLREKTKNGSSLTEQSEEFLYLTVIPNENRIEVVDCNAKKEIDLFDRVAVAAGQQVVNIEVQLNALLNCWRRLSDRGE